MTKEEVKRLIKDSDKYHYVYILKKPDGVPFYVGKGCDVRIFDHERDALNSKHNSHKLNTIRKLLREGKEINYEIQEFFDDEKEAFDLEVDLISEYGRVDLKTGVLTNLDSGGLGGSGSWSEETIKNASDLRSKLYYSKPEYRKLMSDRVKQMYQDHPEVKDKISDSLKHTYETTDLAEQLSQTHKERNKDPEIRHKNSEAQKKVHKENPNLRIQQANKRKQTFQENPDIIESIGHNRRKFNIENPEKFKENQKKAIEAARTPEARAKNAEAKRQWFKDNPERKRIAAERARNFAQQKRDIKSQCNQIIKDNNIQDIHIPSGRSSLQSWNEFKHQLITGI